MRRASTGRIRSCARKWNSTASPSSSNCPEIRRSPVRPSSMANRPVSPAEGPQPVPPREPAEQRNPAWKRKIAQWSRWLHIYLSMVSFAILFFFAVTGLTLNHQQWFAKQQKTLQYKGSMEKGWLRSSAGGGIDKLAVVEFLRARHRISGAMSEFRVDDGQCSVSF